MKFYTKTHQHYCGIDLHPQNMYLCLLDAEGNILMHRNVSAKPEAYLRAILPFRDDLVVGVECMFNWYWLADLCAKHNITFILGHALHLRRIHGGKSKSDKIDSEKIAHHQYNHECFEKNIARKSNNKAIAEKFANPSVRKTLEIDIAVSNALKGSGTLLQAVVRCPAEPVCLVVLKPENFLNSLEHR